MCSSHSARGMLFTDGSPILVQVSIQERCLLIDTFGWVRVPLSMPLIFSFVWIISH